MEVTDQLDTSTAGIGVLVVTYNSADHIDELAVSLPAALDGVSARVVAVDNDSSDDTVARLRHHGIEVIEMGRNAGYSAAINAGIAAMPEVRAVLLLNPDIVIGPGAVPRMLDVLADERVGIVVPQTRNLDGTLAHNQRRDPTLLRAFGPALIGGDQAVRFPRLSEEVADAATYLRPRDIDWGVGAVMLISRDCIDRVGGWDETYFLYSEETDYCQRARRVGFRVRYEPSAIAMHEGGGGVHQPRLRSMMIVNKVRLYRRQHSAVAGSLFMFAHLINEVSRGLMGNTAARAAAHALLVPSRRPPEILCSDSFLPR